MRFGFPGEIFVALKSVPSHSLATSVEWEDRGLFGHRTKRYVVMVTLLSEQEAQQRFNTTNPHHEYMLICFSGEFPDSVRNRVSQFELAQGFMGPYFISEAFIRQLNALGVSLGRDWMPT